MLTYLIIAHDQSQTVQIAEDDDTAEQVPNTGMIVRNFKEGSTVRVWTQYSSAQFKPPEEIILPKLKVFKK